MCRSHSKLVSCNCTATPACSSAINYHFFPPSPINLDRQHFSHPLNFVFTLPRCNLHSATSIHKLFFKIPLTNYTVTCRSIDTCARFYHALWNPVRLQPFRDWSPSTCTVNTTRAPRNRAIHPLNSACWRLGKTRIKESACLLALTNDTRSRIWGTTSTRWQAAIR